MAGALRLLSVTPDAPTNDILMPPEGAPEIAVAKEKIKLLESGGTL